MQSIITIMYSSSKLLSVAAVASVLLNALPTFAQVQKGFNYGSTNSDGSCRGYQDFVNYFRTAKSLPNQSGFASARLYTMIQCGTTNTPISAIQAAIDTDTTLLLGLWASAGQGIINNEIAALQAAANQYGTSFTNRVVGISVGSEDLYRSSPQGVANNAGIGTDAGTLTSYIGQVRSAIANTGLAGKPVGHVDTWTAWVLPQTAPVIGAVDWLGHNSFPYFESTLPNNIEGASGVFNNALGATEGVSGGKPVWVTETGWPVSGPTMNLAVASVDNARSYWTQVACPLLGNRNTWWYTLVDGNANQQEISFGLVSPGGTTPRYDLSC